jgi:hypothetical protein
MLHPFPGNLWVVGMVMFSVLPFVDILWGKSAPLRPLVICNLAVLLVWLVCCYDTLRVSWLWRQAYGSEAYKAAPWWFSPYWEWMAKGWFSALLASCLAGLLVKVVAKRLHL